MAMMRWWWRHDVSHKRLKGSPWGPGLCLGLENHIETSASRLHPPPVTWVCTIRAIFLLCTTHPYLQRNQETLWAIWRHNWQSNHTLGATLTHIKNPSKCPSMWVCPPESGEFAAIDKNHLSHWYTCHLKPLFLCRRGCRKLWTDDGRCGGRWTQDKCTGIQKIETLRSCVFKPCRHAI